MIECTPVDEKLVGRHAHATLCYIDKPPTVSNCQSLSSEERSACPAHSSLNFQIKPIKQKQLVDGVLFSLQEIYGIEKKSSDDELAIQMPIELSASHTSSSIATTATTTTLSSRSSNNDSLRIDCDSDSLAERRAQEEDQELKGIECVICMCETRDTLILPCRHLCLCKLCAMNLRVQSNNCPICRIPFIAILQLKLLRKKETPPIVSADNLPIVKINLNEISAEQISYLVNENQAVVEGYVSEESRNEVLVGATKKRTTGLNEIYEPVSIYEAFNETIGDKQRVNTEKNKKKGRRQKKKVLEPILSTNDLVVKNINEGLFL